MPDAMSAQALSTQHLINKKELTIACEYTSNAASTLPWAYNLFPCSFNCLAALLFSKGNSRKKMAVSQNGEGKSLLQELHEESEL